MASSKPVPSLTDFQADDDLVRLTLELRRAIDSGESVPWETPEDGRVYLERDRSRHK